MDSTGATARTPRRRPPFSLGRRTRPVDAVDTEATDVTSRSFENMHEAMASVHKLEAKKTPRHTYHRKRPGTSGPPLSTASFVNPEDLVVDVQQDEGAPLLSGRPRGASTASKAIKIVLYGVLNTIICVPLMIRYGMQQ